MFLGELSLRGKSGNTRRTYAAGLKALVAYAERRGTGTIEDLNPRIVRAAAHAQMDPTVPHGHAWKGGQNAAANLVIAARELAKELRAQGVQVPDLSDVPVPPPPKRIQPRVQPGEYPQLEAAVLRRLLGGNSLLVQRDLALLRFLAETALRAHEVCALDVAHVNLETGVVAIPVGKGGRFRYSNIRDPHDARGGEAVTALQEYLRVRREWAHEHEAALWVSHKGTRMKPNAVRQILARICRDAGLPNRPPHTFRRGWFTEQYRANPLALPVLVQRMGWSSASQELIKTYTRGAEVEFAAEYPLPSMTKHWRYAEQDHGQGRRQSTPLTAGQAASQQPSAALSRARRRSG